MKTNKIMFWFCFISSCLAVLKLSQYDASWTIVLIMGIILSISGVESGDDKK